MNIALGTFDKKGHRIVGFVTNAKYDNKAKLSPEIILKRAKHLQQVDDKNGLGPKFKDTTLKDKIEVLEGFSKGCWVSVKPENLTILKNPFLIPNDIHPLKTARYILIDLDREKFNELRSLAKTENVTEESFPEGALAERRHRYRERNSKLITKAKERFIENHGGLHCEACKHKPAFSEHLESLNMSIIEAHRDIALSASSHSGETKISEIKMLCPNCHRAIHLLRPWMLVNEFKNEFFPQ